MEKLIDRLLEEGFKPELDISKYQEKILNCYIKNIEEYLV